VHPNHPELSDPVNQVFMNEGPVVKFNANQKYTTDGLSRAVFAEICRREGVPVQYFANRSDMAGGGTLGNISTAHVSINTVDIGLAQLAMHSCFETAGTRDVPMMIRAMRAFYETPLRCAADGEWTL
jgi:aspartyl aminopeptidase